MHTAEAYVWRSASGPFDGEAIMASIADILAEAMRIEGALGAAIADWRVGHCLGATGGGPKLDIQAAAISNCPVLAAKLAIVDQLDDHGTIQDILITTEHQIHLIRPLRCCASLFLYLVLDRGRTNLAIARHRVGKLDADLKR
jgi:hypothetical protein